MYIVHIFWKASIIKLMSTRQCLVTAIALVDEKSSFIERTKLVTLKIEQRTTFALTMSGSLCMNKMNINNNNNKNRTDSLLLDILDIGYIKYYMQQFDLPPFDNFSGHDSLVFLPSSHADQKFVLFHEKKTKRNRVNFDIYRLN